jgi:diphthine-ammonia ligase
MKCGILFSGGKDSVYAAYLAKKCGNEITCLITIISENPDSYMFHTPSISKVKKQAEVMKVPLITQKTKGEKEKELKDLENAIKNAKKKFGIQAIVTGSVESAYQASRIQKICDRLELDCFNPLWQKDQIELLNDLIKRKFKIIITGIFAYPLNKSWLGREINEKFINDVRPLFEKYKINPAGEGGEFESYVLDCPLFSKALEIKDLKIQGKKNSWRMEIEVE